MCAPSLVLLLLLMQDAYQTGLDAYHRHEYVKAAEQFELAIKSAPPDSAAKREAMVFLGQSLYLSNHFKEAIPWLEQAATGQVHPLEVNYMLGVAYVQARQPEKCVTAFAKLYVVGPTSAAARLIAAQMMVRYGFEEDAEKQLRRALELDPKIPEAHLILGELATYHGEIDRAVTELGKEIEINPNFATAYYKLGDAYSRREQWEEAIPNLERSIWLNPNFSGPYILLGKGYLKRKELSNAENTLRQAIRMDPQNYSARYLLGQTLMQAGRTEEARKILEEAKALKGPEK